MLLHTGTVPVQSKNGLLTTVGYKFGAAPATYALEGSVTFSEPEKPEIMNPKPES
jgi:glycerol kinase